MLKKMKYTFCVLIAIGIIVRWIPAEAAPTEDAVAAKAALVMEMESGRVLFSQNGEERLPMASTTKMMTALITLEQPDLDEPFVVDDSALRVEGSSMGLQFGNTVTLRALAAGMLLSSGNDAANAAAVRIAGSTSAFAAQMNERAALMGLKDTRFANPSGLDEDGHYSTAYELALIAKEALINPGFRELCSSVTAQVEFGSPPYPRTLKNHNKLLTLYKGTIGVKTGFTKKAGRCLVSAAEKNGVTLICVTLSCPDDWKVHASLYDRYFEGRANEVLTEMLPEVMIPVTGGMEKAVELVAEQQLSAVLTEEERNRIKWKIYVEPFCFSPVKEGESCGKVEFFLDGERLGSVELKAGKEIPVAQTERQGAVGFFVRLIERIRIR